MTEPNSQPKPTGEELAAKTAAEMALDASELLASRPGADKVGIDKASIDKAGKAAAKSVCARPQIDSVRETVESIAVAFILAFLFRTFVAEAFVIPTGSMATTLMGRHKDLVCPNCKYQFQTGASAECDRATGEVLVPPNPVERAICPNCGMPVDTRNTAEYPSYKGDRIIVSKLASDEPTRWNVTVFRFPEEAGTNYIKRLVGLPGEVIKIQNGDLSSRPIDDPSKPFRILRKPPKVVLSMLRDVYDNDQAVPWMTEAGWPPRWQPCPMDIVALTKMGWGPGDQAAWPWPAQSKPVAGQWTTDDYRSFGTDGSSEGEAWLRYQHFRPDEDAWQELIRRAPSDVAQAYHLPESRPDLREQKREALLEPKGSESLPPLRPKLWAISDFSGYDWGTTRSGRDLTQEQTPWVGDLAIGCEVSPVESRGEVVLELIEGGRRFHCRLNLADRSIQLAADEGALRFEGENGQPVTGSAANAPVAKDAIPAGKPFRVLFANVDSQLLVWVNGKLVEFDGPTMYSLGLTQADKTPADHSPVGIASKGANVRINHLRVLRDVYYLTSSRADEDHGNEFPLRKDPRNPENDQFFMLGDNSPQSLDARAWSRKYVERKLLIGKALYIFWPHSWDSPLPFTPNWKRMQFIR